MSPDPNSKRSRRRAITAWLMAGARDERGVAAVFFALALVLLSPIALGMADLYLGSTQRTQLQDALV